MDENERDAVLEDSREDAIEAQLRQQEALTVLYRLNERGKKLVAALDATPSVKDNAGFQMQYRYFSRVVAEAEILLARDWHGLDSPVQPTEHSESEDRG